MNDTVQESHLYQALENIRKFKVVGIQEYFGEFCLQYFNYLNIDFDIQKTKKHVNKRVNNFSGREVKEANVRLAELNRYDVIFYNEYKSSVKALGKHSN